jgi:hypothetical protein
MLIKQPHESQLVKLQRLGDPEAIYTEIKDPSVIRMKDGSYEMFASVGNSRDEKWKVGHFTAGHPAGSWKEREHVQLHTPEGLPHNLSGLNCCAPAVFLEERDGKPLYKMYIQTTCFQENGVIAIATSQDGTHFHAQPETVASVNTVDGKKLVNVYDSGISEIEYKGEKYLYNVYTGCTKTGCGDLYYSIRPKSGTEKDWSRGKLLMDQKDVPFHNQPNVPHFEWGLEAGQVVQLDKDMYLLAGVCFLDKDGAEHDGTRQRVFLAASRTPFGGFVPIGLAAEPQGQGENGHPDMIMQEGKLGLLYQERAGDKKPWHLRYTEYDLEKLKQQVREHLDAHAEPTLPWVARNAVKGAAQGAGSKLQ